MRILVGVKYSEPASSKVKDRDDSDDVSVGTRMPFKDRTIADNGDGDRVAGGERVGLRNGLGGRGFGFGFGFPGRREDQVGGGGEGISREELDTATLVGAVSSLRRRSISFSSKRSSASCLCSNSSPSIDMVCSSSLSSMTSLLVSHCTAEVVKWRSGFGVKLGRDLSVDVDGRGIRDIPMVRSADNTIMMALTDRIILQITAVYYYWLPSRKYGRFREVELKCR
jgi:hypothetical protein